MGSAAHGKKVAVIGAGFTGLACLKECLAEDLDVVLFESRSEIGGQWAYQEAPGGSSGELQSSIYASVVLNTFRDTTCFSDFPIDPARYEDFCSHQKILEYANEYANHFGLKKHIRFKTKVLSCAQTENGGWTVIAQEAGSEPQTLQYDVVISATGQFTFENMPTWKNQDAFKGKLIHSHYYRRPEHFEGERVVIIGLGSTAVDLASELTATAKEVHLVTRGGGWIIPRYILGKPAEAYDNRATQAYVPHRIGEFLQMCLLSIVQGRYPKDVAPKHRLFEQNITVQDKFLDHVRSGAVKTHKAEVESFSNSGVLLSNGDSIDADVVIACTGYKHDRPYLPSDALRSEDTPKLGVDLYRLIVPIGHDNLYVAGLYESFGPTLPFVEAQARYIAAAITGLITFPPRDQLTKSIRERQAERAKQFVQTPRHESTEMYLPYIDGLLEELGATPTLQRLLSAVFFGGKPWRALMTLNGVLFNVITPAQWRLFGHGKKEELATETISRLASGLVGLSAREKELLER